MKWIELVLGFGCNCRCPVCAGLGAGKARLSREGIDAIFRSSREQGASYLWLGGGEPTLYAELAPVIREARKLGFEQVRLETNAMRLSYPDYARALCDAGVTEVAVSLKGPTAEIHDAMTRVDGSFELLLRAVDNLAGSGVRVTAEYLLTTGSLGGLDGCLRRLAGMGVEGFLLWLVSLHMLDTKSLGDFLPSLDRAGRAVSRAAALAERLGVRLESLHTPPCVLSPKQRRAYRHSGKWDLVVFTPGNRPFRAEESPMEGGHYLPGCGRCRFRADCLGLRQDYLDLRGPAGIRPVAPLRRSKT